MHFIKVFLFSQITACGFAMAADNFQSTQCGPLASNQTCSTLIAGSGACCSAWGWCGNGDLYCGTGCQAAFSESKQCKASGNPAEEPELPPKDRLGNEDEASEPKDTDKPHLLHDPNHTKCPFKTGLFLDASCYTQGLGERCSPNDGGCQANLCCSGAGYCGDGPEYCSVPGNCQQEFGMCDNWRVPDIVGHNVRDDKRLFDNSFDAVITSCKKKNHLALTFDDGPTNYTVAILDLLKAHDAHATFFVAGIVNGRGAIDTVHKHTIKRMYDEGHQIGSHTWSHPVLDTLTSAQRKEEMYNNEQAIYNVINKYPTFMRAPELKCRQACEQDMHDLGYHVAKWQVDSEDWKEQKPDLESTKHRLAADLILHAPVHGMFLIQHDTHAEAVEVARSLLEKIKTENLQIQATTLAECLGLAPEKAYQGKKK